MALYIAISLALGQTAEEADDEFPVTPQAFMEFTESSFTDIHQQLRSYMDAFDSFQVSQKRRMEIATMDDVVGFEIGVDAEQQVINLGEGPIIKLVLEQLDVVTDEIEAARRRLGRLQWDETRERVGVAKPVPRADTITVTAVKFTGGKTTWEKAQPTDLTIQVTDLTDTTAGSVLDNLKKLKEKKYHQYQYLFILKDASQAHPGKVFGQLERDSRISAGQHYYTAEESLPAVPEEKYQKS